MYFVFICSRFCHFWYSILVYNIIGRWRLMSKERNGFSCHASQRYIVYCKRHKFTVLHFFPTYNNTTRIFTKRSGFYLDEVFFLKNRWYLLGFEPTDMELILVYLNPSSTTSFGGRLTILSRLSNES